VTAPVRKSDQVADTIRARIADGSLRAGMCVPSAAELAKETGFAIVTCRRGLRSATQPGSAHADDAEHAVPRRGRAARRRARALARTGQVAVRSRPHAAGACQRDRQVRHDGRPRRDGPALAVPPVLAACRPRAEGRRRPAHPVRRVAGRPAARHDGERARYDDHARSVRRGRSHHHACLRLDAGYGQMGRRVSRHGAAYPRRQSGALHSAQDSRRADTSGHACYASRLATHARKVTFRPTAENR